MRATVSQTSSTVSLTQWHWFI